MKYITTFDFPSSITVECTLLDARRKLCAEYKAMGKYPSYQKQQRNRIRELAAAIRAIRAAKVCHGDNPQIVDNYVPILERASS